jgi:murein DD-endopeptidase MepM/ murein hydrolase activator NlpD
MFQRLPTPEPRISLRARFGIHSGGQLARDVGKILGRIGSNTRPVLDWSTAGFARPDLSLPAYAGFVPTDGIAPIYNFFDRTGGGRGFAGIVTRRLARDFRGGRLTYDEHDGTDFVCPPGTPLASAAPGVLVAVRETFLRGGLTACVDHGHGVITQYTHLSRMVASVGQTLERGETVALSGSAGIDMLSGFPWVPPHLHFMVWVRGRPVDPYLPSGEPARAGSWMHGNDPRPSGPLDDDAHPAGIDAVAVNKEALAAVIARCQDKEVRQEIEGARHAATQLALLEDSLHHDRHAWPAACAVDACRPAADATAVRLTLPMPSSLYRSARASDAPWTAPRSS